MINLHAIVNPIISNLHPNYSGTLYRSLGQANNDSGLIIPKYAEGVKIIMQLQSLSDDKLYHSGNVGENDITRNAYLYSASSTQGKPESIVRPFARTGDIIQHEDGTWWLITACREDFNKAGWVNASITLQVKAPDFSGSDWYEA